MVVMTLIQVGLHETIVMECSYDKNMIAEIVLNSLSIRYDPCLCTSILQKSLQGLTTLPAAFLDSSKHAGPDAWYCS